MTRARAPGKIVISGAYAVLSGAPAIVSAVSRYVVADTSQPPHVTTDEVRAGLKEAERAPWFDASELRQDGRKLGLGSSAAILVASLYALECAHETHVDETALRARVFERGLAAHRKAQAGGSGVDVAASTFGGTLVYRLQADGAQHASVALPPELCLEVWVCPSSASTPALIAAVAKLAQSSPTIHANWLGAQAAAAAQAARSIAQQDDAAGFLAALRAQHHALLGLGTAAGVPIVTPELAELGPRAENEGGVLLPAGAGGGDIALFVGHAPSSDALRAALENFAHRRLAADKSRLSAPGVSVA